MHHLFITPNAQNQRVGTAKLYAAEQLLKCVGYLKCLSENKKALSFYLAQGWEAVSTGESVEDRYIFISKKTYSVKPLTHSIIISTTSSGCLIHALY